MQTIDIVQGPYGKHFGGTFFSLTPAYRLGEYKIPTEAG
jgi:hypothetical protein